jgi:hypothetical protein
LRTYRTSKVDEETVVRYSRCLDCDQKVLLVVE